MTQQQQPLNYANWQTVQPRKKSWSRGFFAWVLFIALAVLLFMLLNKTDNQYTQIPLSEFQLRLVGDQVRRVVLTGDEIYGQFNNPQPVAGAAGPVTDFRTSVSEGVGGTWGFMQWVLDNRHNAVVEVDNNKDLLINVLAPLIPWLLIFLFIWFFVFRNLRKQQQPPQAIPVYIMQAPPQAGPPLSSGGAQT